MDGVGPEHFNRNRQLFFLGEGDGVDQLLAPVQYTTDLDAVARAVVVTAGDVTVRNKEA